MVKARITEVINIYFHMKLDFDFWVIAVSKFAKQSTGRDIERPCRCCHAVLSGGVSVLARIPQGPSTQIPACHV